MKNILITICLTVFALMGFSSLIADDKPDGGAGADINELKSTLVQSAIDTGIIAPVIASAGDNIDATLQRTGAEHALSAQPVATATQIIKYVTSTNTLPYKTTTSYSNGYAKGTTNNLTYGQTGIETVTHAITYIDGVEQSRTVTSRATTRSPVDAQIVYGTYTQPTAIAAPVAPSSPSGCDPNYSPCIRISSTDLNCKDIKIQVRVIGVDIHNFDRDNDGKGCESY